MTNKKLISILKEKIRRVKKQKADLDAINPDTIRNQTAKAVVTMAKHHANLLAYGRLYAYREIYRTLKHKS